MGLVPKSRSPLPWCEGPGSIYRNRVGSSGSCLSSGHTHKKLASHVQLLSKGNPPRDFFHSSGEGGWEVCYAVSGIRYRKINIAGTSKRSKPLIKDVDPTSTTTETQYQAPGRSHRVGRRFPRHGPAGKRAINMHTFAKTCVGSKRLGTNWGSVKRSW